MDRVVVEVGIQEQGVGKRQAGKREAVNNEEDNCFELIQTESEYVQWKEQQPEPPTGIREREKGKEMIKYQLEIIGGIDPEIIKEYPRVRDRHEFLAKQSIDLEESIKSLNKISNELDKKIKTQFQESFSKINHAFNRYFKIIFNGGDAKIELSENIDNEVVPPCISSNIS